MGLGKLVIGLGRLMSGRLKTEDAHTPRPDPSEIIARVGLRCATQGFYVYAHTSIDGAVFYVGKGSGDRAWSISRDDIWRHYIRTRLGGRYRVEIVKDGLNEEAALELEGELIEEYGEQLVNWINPGRGFDYEAIERYHALRDAMTTFVSKTRPLETSDPELAVARYREALDRVFEYAGIKTETGLVADIQNELGRADFSDILPLDRLTLVLARLQRHQEIIDAVDAYFLRFPDSVTPNHAVHRRRATAAAVLAGTIKPRKAPTPARTRTSKVDEEALGPLLAAARQDRVPGNWLLAARLCRKARDYQREHDLLAEFLSGPRVPGRSWLEIEQRLHKVKALLA